METTPTFTVGQEVTYVAPFTRDRIKVRVLSPHVVADGHGKPKVHIALPYNGWDLWVPLTRIKEA